MKRILRSKRNQPIIELSDSDDEDHKTNYQQPIVLISEDEDYIIEDNKTKKKIIEKSKEKKTNYQRPIVLESEDEDYIMEDNKTKKKIIEKSKEKKLKKNTQNKVVKSKKRKVQEENSETFNNKKPKLEESSFDYTDAETLQQNQKDFIKTDIKQDIKIKEKLNSSFSQCMEWTNIDYISEINKVDKNIVKNVVKLFQEDNTIPFIARYRKNMTGSMEPDQLRALKESFEEAKTIKQRAATILKTIDKLGKWSPEIHSTITSAKCLADLEDIYALYKPTSKRLLAERARELGLESISNAVLHGQKIIPLVSLINEQKEGLQNEQQVRNGIVHIIADVITKDKKVFNAVTAFRRTSIIHIETSQCKAAGDSNNANEQKYKYYFNFSSTESNIKPHHIMAINRAESQKIINVKIIIPDTFEHAFKEFCLSQYTRQQEFMGNVTKLHRDLLSDSIDYAYKKVIKPQVIRRVRSEMKEKAEKASIQVFATNVKQLLLASPVRGKIILGIDPGYYHGCKLAVISEYGDVLETAVIHPHNNKSSIAADNLAKLVNKYKCTILALGNATACRKTEFFLTEMIQSKMFDLDVTYTIVDESGASIYSCNSEAKSEFPDLDPNLVSAISIARRLQDPLAELVKIEPKHLGVGMYQHDLPEKQLTNALDEVVTEAVSFVGVDINTASQCLLRRVAGLTNSRASNIIEWRIKHGAFRNREQLLDVKGIGKKTFEQCAGFIRIRPETAMMNETTTKENKKSKNDLNLLDQTWIHPESYTIANKFLKHCQCKLDDLGTPAFIERINSHAKMGYAKLAAQFDSDETTMEIIIRALTMKKDEDIRLKSNCPVFRDSVQCINDLNVGTILTGVVRNVTHFGTFVDVGVERDGLIPIIRMKQQTLHIGQHVEVKVIQIELALKRISLDLMRTL